ncbi:MAG: hypothetical protein Q7J73_05735 [Dehalococcoidales bacterium]|nr:hypothetical protein [Dehalococcoidales bacterium]
MRVYNSFIAALALSFALITVIMAAYRVETLDAYFAVYTIALLVLTSLYMFFSPRARRALNQIGIGAFGGFMVVVAIKVVEILRK